jgi:outer membrane protein assembly factor BamD
MFRFKRPIAGRMLAVIALVGLVSSMCSRQQINAKMDPGDRLALADRLRSENKCVKAVEQYEKLLSEFPTPQVAELARFNLATCHLELEQYDVARAEFDSFVDTYPKSERVDNALYMIGLSYLRSAPRAERDQTQVVKALNEFVLLLREYPESDVREEAESAVAECRSRLAEKEYLAGKLYLNMKDYGAARVYFDSVVETYRDTAWAPRALFLKGKSYVGQNRLEEARSAFRQVVDDFPGSGVSAEAARELEDLDNVRPAGTEAESGS